MRVAYELSVCTDCLVWLANGDDSGMPTDTRDQRIHATNVRESVGVDADDVHRICVGEGDRGFCTSSCDTCGDRSHGDRFTAAVLK